MSLKNKKNLFFCKTKAGFFPTKAFLNKINDFWKSRNESGWKMNSGLGSEKIADLTGSGSPILDWRDMILLDYGKWQHWFWKDLFFVAKTETIFYVKETV